MLTVPSHTKKDNPRSCLTRIRNTSDANPLPARHLIGQVPPPTKTPATPPPGTPHRHPQCRHPPFPSESSAPRNTWYGERLDLDHAIHACLANARTEQDKRAARDQDREPQARGRVTVYEPEDCEELVRQYLEHAPRRTGSTLIPIQV